MSADSSDPLIADFVRFKARTEALWAEAELDPAIAGYQFQRGTRWNPGLAADEIEAYERALGVRFPESFRRMLSVMNGTDLPTLNVYGTSGHEPHEWVGVYAWPRDLQIVREYVEYAGEERAEVDEVLARHGVRMERDAGLVPVYIHRFLVCGADPLDGPVLSIHGRDVIVYAPDLMTYLRKEFLENA